MTKGCQIKWRHLHVKQISFLKIANNGNTSLDSGSWDELNTQILCIYTLTMPLITLSLSRVINVPYARGWVCPGPASHKMYAARIIKTSLLVGTALCLTTKRRLCLEFRKENDFIGEHLELKRTETENQCMISCAFYHSCMAFNYHVVNQTCILLPEVECMPLAPALGMCSFIYLCVSFSMFILFSVLHTATGIDSLLTIPILTPSDSQDKSLVMSAGCCIGVTNF